MKHCVFTLCTWAENKSQPHSSWWPQRASFIKRARGKSSALESKENLMGDHFSKMLGVSDLSTFRDEEHQIRKYDDIHRHEYMKNYWPNTACSFYIPTPAIWVSPRWLWSEYLIIIWGDLSRFSGLWDSPFGLVLPVFVCECVFVCVCGERGEEKERERFPMVIDLLVYLGDSSVYKLKGTINCKQPKSVILTWKLI